jgi:hypothetical protein
MNEASGSRWGNLVRGAIAGAVLASLIFGGSYGLSSSRPELAINRVTVEAFAAFVPWRWFGGIVSVVALYGFIFNIRLGHSLWDLFDSVRDFKKD